MSVNSGFFCVDKPKGITSHNVISRMRRILNMKKVGHSGTLDPMATGVLIVGVGTSTRLLDYVQSGMKEYVATLKFGEKTDTGDADGDIIDKIDMGTLSAEEVEVAILSFVGDIEQIPPMVSAIKVDGKKLYEYAREGKEVERKVRKVHIGSIKLERFESSENPVADIRVTCSAGTYVRTLAEDIAASLNGCAHLIQLRRTKNGNISEESCITLEELEQLDDPFSKLIQPSEAVSHLPKVILTQDQEEKVSLGKQVSFDENQQSAIDDYVGPFCVTGENLVSIYDIDENGTYKLKCNIFI